MHHDGEELTLVATNPAAGFRAKENDRSGRKVEVTFRSGDHEFEITVRLDDGVMEPRVVDKSERSIATPFPTTHPVATVIAAAAEVAAAGSGGGRRRR